jgi:para-nitrobenzyl esterase
VTLNYRLGILGFYSMDGHIKENIGVLDQITALKWITSNIQDFNGNPVIFLFEKHRLKNI